MVAIVHPEYTVHNTPNTSTKKQKKRNSPFSIQLIKQDKVLLKDSKQKKERQSLPTKIY